jgi:hypothetical protein
MYLPTTVTTLTIITPRTTPPNTDLPAEISHPHAPLHLAAKFCRDVIEVGEEHGFDVARSFLSRMEFVPEPEVGEMRQLWLTVP